MTCQRPPVYDLMNTFLLKSISGGLCFATSSVKFGTTHVSDLNANWYEIFPSEEEAFEAIAAAYNRYTLLLDTYDPRHAIHTAIEVALRAQETLGHTIAGVRLDSGDILGDSLYVREQLDAAGLTNVRIIASGDLDEWKILDLLQAGAAIDSFGVGTALGAGRGSPERGFAGGALGAAY